MKSPFKNPLVVALDVDTELEAMKLVEDLHEIVGGFKVGPRLSIRYGESLIKRITEHAPVFIDNKHFDIPSTMVAAIRASFDAGASLATVHAMSGHEALKKLAELEIELNKQRFFKILAVTILTSWNEKSYPSILKQDSVANHVLELSQLVLDSGLSGIVCSPLELELLKNRNHYLVTPGIRFDLEAHSDQKRIMSPKEALRAGSNILVVGRPIIHAKNPKETATDYSMSLFE